MDPSDRRTPATPAAMSDGGAAVDEQRAHVLTQLVDEVFRLNATFLAEGDALAGSAGLSAARWRVLGQLVEGPATVAQVARRRGLRRQSVQESVHRLESDGLVIRIANDADRRAPLVVLTEQGQAALARIEPDRRQWAMNRSAGLGLENLRSALSLLRQLRAEAEPLGG